VGSCYLGPLFFSYPPGDHFLDPSHLAKDDLRDKNFVATDLGAHRPDGFRACYFLAGFVALPKIDPKRPNKQQ
jgi:hypothetical protein